MQKSSTILSHSKGKAFALATTLGLGASTIVPAPAGASGLHSTYVWRGTHLLTFEGQAQNQSGGTEYWDTFSLAETPIPPTWMSVCDYQGAIAIYNPDGSFGKQNKTAFHENCANQGAYPSNATAGTYAENKRFTGKWISSSSQVGNQWRVIGTLVD